MISINIRPVIREDLPFLWNMLYECIYTPVNQERPGRDILNEHSIAHYLQDWGRTGDFGLIAMDAQGESAGSVWMRYFKYEDRGYGYVADDIPELSMAVRPEYRGMGFGTRLLKALIEEAKVREIHSLSLSVDPNNPAMQLYERFGFKGVGAVGTSLTMLVHMD